MVVLNKISRNIILCSLLISILVLSACSGGSSNKSNVGNSVGTLDPSVYSGKEGLVLTIKKAGNDFSVFEESEIQLLFTLKNNGAYDIKKLVFSKLLNDWRYIKNDVAFSEDSKLKIGEELATEDYTDYPFLQGKSILSKTTVDTRFTCTFHSAALSKTEDQHTETMLFQYCYDYETTMQDTFCVDTDIYETSTMKKSCKPAKKSYSNGQGAPVSIDSIDVTYSEKNGKIYPNIKLQISSSRTGKVLSERGYSNLCLMSDTGDANRDVPFAGVVKIKSIEFSRFSNRDFNCYNDFVKIDNVDGTLCQLDDSLGFEKKEGNFVTGFTIVLSYYYQDSKSIDVVIKKPSN